MRAAARGVIGVLLLAGCEEEVADRPAPVALTGDALGHYCQMTLLEHPGPKAQLHLEGLPAPVWFAQVRDAVGYLRLGERTAPVAAVYVNDMGAAPDWARPGAANWIDAESAIYVIGSDARGGMGAPELVPFAARAAAEAFRARRGGMLAAFAEIPDDAVLGPVAIEPPAPHAGGGG